jgi:hypothetical protein
VTKKDQHPLVRGFALNAKRLRAKVYTGWWFAIAIFEDGRGRIEIYIDEKRLRRTRKCAGASH